jgi:hypothetical protein
VDKRWNALFILVATLTLGVACGSAEATIDTEIIEVENQAPPNTEDTQEAAAEVPDAEAVDTGEFTLVDSDVCERFDPPTPAPITAEAGSMQVIREDDWSRGPEDATVVFLVYSDFQ